MRLHYVLIWVASCFLPSSSCVVLFNELAFNRRIYTTTLNWILLPIFFLLTFRLCSQHSTDEELNLKFHWITSDDVDWQYQSF